MSELTLQELITRSKNLRTEATEYTRLADEAKAQREEIDQQSIEILESQGVDSTRTDVATVSISKVKHANVEDWDAFAAYVVDNHAVYLLQRRVAGKAVEELVSGGEEVPGVVFYEKKSLNLRSR